MATSQISEFVQHLRTSMLRRDGAGLTDGQLLECFLSRRDGAAMEALVRRHGPMVWSVCRRLLNHHDAEDAFQATFLVLVRKAVSIVPREMVANWLYGVAHQTALKARATVAKRKGRERQMTDMPEPVSGPSNRTAAMEKALWPDLQPLLDQELSRLPDKYRAAIVLCDLDGKTRKEAARQLGLPEGTIASRLARARTMLAKRLSRYAPTISGGTLAVMLSQNASACVPAPVLSATIKTATVFAVGKTAAAGVVSAKVVALTEGVLRTMLLTKLKITTAALMMLTLACYGFTVLVHMAPASPGAGGLIASAPAVSQADRGDSSQPSDGQKKPAAGRLLVFRDTKFVLMTPDGKEIGELPNRLDGLVLNEPVLSPDGKRVAFTVTQKPPTDQDGNVRHQVFIRAVDGQDDGFKLAINALNIAWTPDGKGLIAVELLPGKEIKDRGLATWLVDVGTKQPSRLDLPRWMHPFAITPDGKAFVGAFYDLDARKIHLTLISRDGKDITKLTEIQNEGPDPKPSPDGKRILFQDYDPSDKLEKDMPRLFRLFVYDLRTKKRERLAGVPLNASIESFCWSPDGKRLAYTWKQAKPGVPLAENTNNMNDPKLNTETESFLVIADADGRNAKTMLSAKSPRSTTITIGTMDWR
jgi:RNA polymerase sigma factor (sigma-70 family)